MATKKEGKNSFPSSFFVFGGSRFQDGRKSGSGISNTGFYIFFCFCLQDEISKGEEQAGEPGLQAQEEGAARGQQAQATRTRGGTQ